MQQVHLLQANGSRCSDKSKLVGEIKNGRGETATRKEPDTERGGGIAAPTSRGGSGQKRQQNRRQAWQKRPTVRSASRRAPFALCVPLAFAFFLVPDGKAGSLPRRQRAKALSVPKAIDMLQIRERVCRERRPA